MAPVRVPHSPQCCVRLCLGAQAKGTSLGAVVEALGNKRLAGWRGRKEALEAGGLALPWLLPELAPAEGVSWRVEREGQRGGAGQAGRGA